MDKVQIIIDNVYAKIIGADKDAEFAIWNELSFQVEDFQSEQVRKRHLFNRKTKKTYTGLVPYVERILTEQGFEYEVIDSRVKPESNADFALVKELDIGGGKTVPLKSRPYQDKIIGDCQERECLQAATGAGKTFMMAGIIAKFNVKPVLVFADKLSLVTQIKDEFEKFLGVEVGIIGGGQKEIRDITICSVQSMINEDELLKNAQMIMFDECHHLPSNTMNEVARKAEDAYYRIGVSATPWRDGGDDLLIEAILSKRKPENSINASKLIDLEFLVPCTIYFVPMKQVVTGKTYHTVYKKAIVENDERNKAIVKIAHQMHTMRNMTTLILIQQVKHGEILQEMLFKKIPEKSFTVTVKNPKNGKEQLVRVRNVEFLSGQDDPIRRRAVIQATKEKKVQVLIGSTIADEGLDVPSLDCLILAGGGKSSTRAFQRIGRVLRLFTDPVTGKKKDRAVCFDFVDYTPMLRRHSRVREKLYLTEEKWDIKYFNPALLRDDE
jgi:superfamily II DNA or RNA helicase